MNVYEKKFQKTSIIVFNDYSSSGKYVCFTLSAQQCTFDLAWGKKTAVEIL